MISIVEDTTEFEQRKSSLHGAIVTVIAVLLLAGPAVGTASATSPDVGEPVTHGDTIPITAPRLFERRVLFSPDYLGRLLHAAWISTQPEVVLEILPPDERGRAAAYARQYRISEALALQIIESALREGVDPELAFRLIRAESRFRTTARGPRGALGLMQLMPSTARALDRTLRTESDILDPARNLRTGLRYLRSLIDRYNGDVHLGLLAYNRGTGAVDRALREGRDPENGYTARVLGIDGTRYTGSGVVDPPM